MSFLVFIRIRWNIKSYLISLQNTAQKHINFWQSTPTTRITNWQFQFHILKGKKEKSNFPSVILLFDNFIPFLFEHTKHLVGFFKYYPSVFNIESVNTIRSEPFTRNIHNQLLLHSWFSSGLCQQKSTQKGYVSGLDYIVIEMTISLGITLVFNTPTRLLYSLSFLFIYFLFFFLYFQ